MIDEGYIKIDLEWIKAGSPDLAYGTAQRAEEFRRLYRESAFAADGITIMAGHDEGIIGTGHDMAEASRRIMQLSNHD